MALTWRYSLTDAEQASSSSPGYGVKWCKFNFSSWVFTEVASYTVFFGTPSFGVSSDPRYEVGRPIASDSATLVINDVKTNDEGLYKIQYQFASGKVNESEANLTVLGVFLFLHVCYDYHSNYVCTYNNTCYCSQQINFICCCCYKHIDIM